ncbi:DsbA family protein, partial [Patescibacteria group bacterium]|nr:DsbA family protein [Patescibacteria group bacterium]
MAMNVGYVNNKTPWFKSFWGVIFLISLALIIGLGVAFGFAVFNYKKQIESGNVPAEFINGNVNEEFVPGTEARLYPGRDNNPSIGPADTKAEVIMFEDFECPYCGQFFQDKKEIINEYQDRVLFVFRNFPMESIHENAMQAALAGECANEQGKFWEMHD